MVVAHLRVMAVALVVWPALSTPVVADASTQSQPLSGEAAVQTSDCWKSLSLFPGVGTDGRTACKR